MYTDKRKFLYGIILILVAVCCVVSLISGKEGLFYYIGAFLGIFIGIAFLKSSRI